MSLFAAKRVSGRSGGSGERRRLGAFLVPVEDCRLLANEAADGAAMIPFGPTRMCEAIPVSLRQRELARRAEIGHPLCVGKVLIKVRLTNQGDLVAVQRKFTKAKPRTVEAEALVDTGATRLYLQSSLIKALGLRKESEVQSKTTNGVRRRAVFEPVRLELMGRNGVFQAVEVDDDVPNLLGQIPLEYLDFVVDPRGHKLIPNRAHGDKQMSEEY